MVLNSFKLSKTHVKGKGVDTVGQFSIAGTVQGNHVQFVKQYIGQHKVEYSGMLSKDKKSIDGTWAMPDYGISDTFGIKVSLTTNLTRVEELRRKLSEQRLRLRT